MRGIKLFYFVLAGQGLSFLGSSLTNFALGVWAFQRGGMVSDFTYIAIAATLPGLVLGPFLGACIDRWDRRRTLLGAQLCGALSMVLLAVLYWAGNLEVWQIVLIVPIGSVCAMVLQVGFSSTLTMVLSKEQLPRANGVMGLTFGTIMLASPLLAGVILDSIGMRGIFLLDVVSFVFGIGTLAVISFPGNKKDPDHYALKASSVVAELIEGWRYLRSRKGVAGTLALFSLIVFNLSLIQVLILPLVLSIGTRTDLGFIQSVGGAGILAGGAVMVIWKGPERKMLAILGAAFFMAVILSILPLFTTIAIIAAGAFLIMFAAPVANVSSKTLWQKKTDPAFQGRVFSLRNTVLGAAQPLAFLSAGWLADNYFEPLMAAGGSLANTFGSVWGVGEGRGVALLMSISGVASLFLVSLSLMIPAMRRIDIDLPDYDMPSHSDGRSPAVSLKQSETSPA